MTTLILKDNRIRPVTIINGMNALIDTGAVISVCNLSKEVFELLFDVKIKQPDSIVGFGGECKGTKYLVRKLEIGDIAVNDLPFFVPDDHYSEEVIVIAGTVFKGYAYEIDMTNHVMTLRPV